MYIYQLFIFSCELAVVISEHMSTLITYVCHTNTMTGFHIEHCAILPEFNVEG